MKGVLWLRVFQNRRVALTVAGTLTAVIAILDWRTVPAFSIGFLYVLPILVAAGSLNRWQLAVFCAVCDLLREEFGAYHWDQDSGPRILTAFAAYFGAGLFASEVVRNRRRMLVRMAELAEQVNARKAAEQQLRGAVEGSPAATLTIDGEGKILLANESAHQLLNCEPPTLPGKPIDLFLPSIATFCRPNSIRSLVRTMIECSGRRQTGETFLAHVWVASAGRPCETGLTAVIFDTSEQLRACQEEGLHTLVLSARVVMGAFWHETRNLCSAMQVLITRLKQRPGVGDTEEVEALNALVDGLQKLSSAGLHPEADETFHVANLRAVLDHLRIIIEPWREESQIEVTWQEPPNLPLVRADHHALLQVFLNLTSNARRALEASIQKRLTVDVAVQRHQVFIRFGNTGAPVADPSTLFAPFQPGAVEHGIGLHVSRALVRTFGGDLRYEPLADGSRFTVVLEPRYLPDACEQAGR